MSMVKRVKALKQERTDLRREAEQLLAPFAAGGQELTPEARERDDAIHARLDAIADELSRYERLLEADRTAEPDEARAADAGDGFSSFGAFLQAVANAARPGVSRVDPRLFHAGPSGASSSVPSDGGYLVRKDWTLELLNRAIETSQLAARCFRVPIGEGSDGLEAPYIDETSRATGSRWGGVQVYRRAEADSVTATKPKVGKLELRLEDMMGLAYATDRLLKDATALGAIMKTAFSSEFAFKLDDEIIRGTGAGQCLGILNSGAVVSVAKETSQVADTIVAENVLKMRARMWTRGLANSIWLINQDAWPQLPQMVVKVKNVAGSENVGGFPIWIPAGGISGQPFDMLLGRPVVPIEQCATVGDQGDILFVDLSQYLLIDKGGIEGAESMHVRFIYDEMTFRFIYRINGQPIWKSSLTPYKGSATISPFVALDARA